MIVSGALACSLARDSFIKQDLNRSRSPPLSSDPLALIPRFLPGKAARARVDRADRPPLSLSFIILVIILIKPKRDD